MSVTTEAVAETADLSGSGAGSLSCASGSGESTMLKVGFLGGGRMAHALAKGFISAGLTKGESIIASCHPADVVLAEAFKSLGSTVTYNNPEVAQKSDVIIISTKPSVVPMVLAEAKPNITPKNLLISVAMGITLKQLESLLPPKTRVVRAMPNTPALVKQGASVFVCGSAASKDDAVLTKKLFEAVGICEQVPEYLLDAVTGLSGSGPAYIYVLIEAMADGAVRMGIPRDLAYRLAAQTVVGAGRMVLETKEHPGVLKDNVTSPAGSTAAALYHLEKSGFRSAVIGALEAATLKSKEISKTIAN
ncbi:pyrroline-5-carboxylate reductase 3 [Macrosteles quadrilineatus]|uniref:pyrroline-5-carboxylate reductase 3 n=1 Tax=Macrosteles quadrilineatus TaxID=74068 RepID=UPI0023E30CF2|nr:pyrroline-5-carboxylate reductase 3 [Macrosteles quadrilineatus]